MLNLSEIHFPMPCDHDPHNPPKPRYTAHEDMEAASREMHKTIGRMLDFEKQLNDKVEKMLSLVTSDNVTFKETFNNAYRVFLEDVRKEVNGYESNMDSAFRLFTTTIEHNYASLSDDCKAQIKEYYDDVVLYIKHNINSVVTNILENMQEDGSLDGVIQSHVFVTPEMYGAVGDGTVDDTDAITNMFASAHKNYVFAKTYRVSDAIEIPANAVLVSNNATFAQNTFGKGVFKTSSDNIHFHGTFNFVQNGTKSKMSVEGVECSAFLMQGTASNITIDHFTIKNFVGGVVFGGSKHTNILMRHIYVEKCDFGVWGANAHGVTIDVLGFKDIDNSQNEPAHALYLTCNDAVVKSSNVSIGRVYGENCAVGDDDCVISVKATSGFYCDNVNVKNVNCVFTILNSSGAIRNVVADGVRNYCFMVQGSCADGKRFDVTDGRFSNMNCAWYGYSVGDGANANVRDCVFKGTTSSGFVYISAVNHFEELNCVHENTLGSTIKCYNVATNDKALVHNPTITGMGLVNFINYGTNVVFEIDPRNLCEECNNVTYHTVYLNNEHFVHLSDISNNNLYNNIIAVGAVIIKLRGNGVFTILNHNNTSAIVDNGTGALVLKDGKTQYTKDEWKIKMFRVIDNVAYEI